MIPAPFAYERVDSVDGAIAALAEHGDEAKLLAGGMSLLPLMKLRLAVPNVLVDVGRLGDQRRRRLEGDELVIGALCRHAELERDPLVRSECGVLAAVAAEVGDPQVRHRGTIGGSVAHGDPASDLPAVLVALDASIVLAGPSGRRVVPASDFFLGFLTTALAPDEMVVELRLPRTGPGGFDYRKFRVRAQDWAVVGALAVVAGATTRVSLVNMGPTPVRARAVEAALAAGAGSDEAAEVAAEGTDAPHDRHATREFREHLARVLVRRALAAAS